MTEETLLVDEVIKSIRFETNSFNQVGFLLTRVLCLGGKTRGVDIEEVEGKTGRVDTDELECVEEWEIGRTLVVSTLIGIDDNDGVETKGKMF